MMHEAQLHEENSFITLTYAPEHLPDFGSLDRKAIPWFMKRLRHEAGPGVRYFGCGEYGSELGRPHYHLCLFGYAFPDRVQTAERGGHAVYRSDLLDRLWPYGHHEIGSLTRESAQYVAKYCTKKINGPPAEDHYSRVDTATGEVVSIEPEFATQSNRPGIGAEWFHRFWRDVYPHDHVIVDGKEFKPPRYYDKLCERHHPEVFHQVQLARSEEWRETLPESRLRAIAEVREARASLFGGRSYEDA